MILQIISILVEVFIAVLGLLIALQKKKIYGWGIFATFLIYVFYDFAKMGYLTISNILLEIIFFIATLSAFYFAFKLYKEKRK